MEHGVGQGKWLSHKTSKIRVIGTSLQSTLHFAVLCKTCLDFLTVCRLSVIKGPILLAPGKETYGSRWDPALWACNCRAAVGHCEYRDTFALANVCSKWKTHLRQMIGKQEDKLWSPPVGICRVCWREYSWVLYFLHTSSSKTWKWNSAKYRTAWWREEKNVFVLPEFRWASGSQILSHWKLNSKTHQPKVKFLAGVLESLLQAKIRAVKFAISPTTALTIGQKRRK